MNEKTSKLDHDSEQKSSQSNMENRRPNTASAVAEDKTTKAGINCISPSFLRKDNHSDESVTGIRYNFISKHYNAIRDAAATGMTVSMGSMAVALSSGVLFDSMKLVYSSMYFAAAGVASALLLTANALYNKRVQQS